MEEQTAQAAQKRLRLLMHPEKRAFFAHFFKTGKGEYAEGDVFLGLTVPETRSVVKIFQNLPEKEILILLHSPYHEERLLALFILVFQFETGDEQKKRHIYTAYLQNTAWINNWDLIDLSAYKIVGAYLFDKDVSILHALAKSNSIWEKRIAILSTYHFIKKGISKHTYNIAKILLRDPHDLIQKAVGWMLREAGKRCDAQEEIDFVQQYGNEMPRTMLRYAIERWEENIRQKTLKQTSR